MSSPEVDSTENDFVKSDLKSLKGILRVKCKFRKVNSSFSKFKRFKR